MRIWTGRCCSFRSPSTRSRTPTCSLPPPLTATSWTTPLGPSSTGPAGGRYSPPMETSASSIGTTRPWHMWPPACLPCTPRATVSSVRSKPAAFIIAVNCPSLCLSSFNSWFVLVGPQEAAGLLSFQSIGFWCRTWFSALVGSPCFHLISKNWIHLSCKMEVFLVL